MRYKRCSSLSAVPTAAELEANWVGAGKGGRHPAAPLSELVRSWPSCGTLSERLYVPLFELCSASRTCVWRVAYREFPKWSRFQDLSSAL